MTEEATTPEHDEAAEAIELMAQQAEREESAEQAADDAATGEWEDVDAQEEQAAAVARMMVQVAGMAAGMIHPGHSLSDEKRHEGEIVMLPVARDFSGELPEWLKPYMHYLGAGMWLGGVMIGAYKARKAEDAEREQEKREAGEGGADGVQS
jgi:hypothetical protein